MKIILNGKIEYTETDSLKTFLQVQGFNFPCAARGICGKCIVKAPTLSITERDKRMLSVDQLEQGLRLACDKKMVDGLEVNADIVTIPHFGECDAYAIIYKDIVEVAIVADDFVDTRLTTIEDNSLIAIRSLIAHELLEMLEKYSVAKATTLYIVGDKKLVSLMSKTQDLDEGESFVGADLMLPTEDVFVVPFRGYDDSIDYLVSKSGTDLKTAIKRVVTDFRFRLKL